MMSEHMNYIKNQPLSSSFRVNYLERPTTACFDHVCLMYLAKISLSNSDKELKIKYSESGQMKIFFN